MGLVVRRLPAFESDTAKSELEREAHYHIKPRILIQGLLPCGLSELGSAALRASCASINALRRCRARGVWGV